VQVGPGLCASNSTKWRFADAETAKSLGLYEQAKELAAERTVIEGQLAAAGPEPSLPPMPELRQRIAAEFDRMEAVLASGTLEQRRELVASYVHSLTALPEEETVRIGLLPGTLSQMVEESERSSSQSTSRRAF
jgi:hypothetical protein